MIQGYEDKIVQKFEYETTAISNKNIIGTCELGKATIQLLNESNNYSELKQSWIKTRFGSFYVYDVTPVQEKINIKLSCYDVKYKLDTQYDSSKHSFPCTLKAWRNSIFTDCGVTYDDSDFPNSDLVLNNEPDIGNAKTNRQVLCLIAQAGCSFIDTDYNDKFYFRWFTNKIHIVKDWMSLTTEKTSTNPINLVVLGRGDVEDIVYYPKIKPQNPVEFKIDNNYILDPQSTENTEDLRETTIIPIYDRVNGFNYIIYNLSAYLIDNKLSIKLGDKISYKDILENELESVVMTKKLEFIGGSSEDDNNYLITLSAEKIEETNSDLKLGVNIIEKVNEVSIKADKNEKKITLTNAEVENNKNKIASLTMTSEKIKQSIEETNSEFETNYNKLIQDIAKTVIAIQNSGGSNLIKNSVMFAYDSNKNPSDWEVSEEGTLTINSSAEALNNGSLSGHVFTLNGKKVKQRINVKIDNDLEEKTYYTFSAKIKKDSVGSCYIKLSNSNEEYTIELNAGETSFYGDYDLKALLPKDSYYDIEFYGSEGSNATFTDIMLNVGEYKTQWSQASGEIMNTQVNINVDGILVKSLVYDGDYTIMSPLEFSGYSNIRGIITKVFSLNKDTTFVKKLEAQDEIRMDPIKVVPRTSGEIQGWAFVMSLGGGN